jgi:hypothetical protein
LGQQFDHCRQALAPQVIARDDKVARCSSHCGSAVTVVEHLAKRFGDSVALAEIYQPPVDAIGHNLIDRRLAEATNA